MATRSLIMVVNREHARGNSLGLAIHPENVATNSYVNMYLHHDGYPEGRGVEIAVWLQDNNEDDGAAMAGKLVCDMYYDSCYLYPSVSSIDHQYTYVIWTGDKHKTMITCYDNYSTECIFVLTPKKLIEKYKYLYESNRIKIYKSNTNTN
tara:strand:+ start:818 stop:1267 length:450 start_codon:yes stop_codon:yes gene_type:complete